MKYKPCVSLLPQSVFRVVDEEAIHVWVVESLVSLVSQKIMSSSCISLPAIYSTLWITQSAEAQTLNGYTAEKWAKRGEDDHHRQDA